MDYLDYSNLIFAKRALSIHYSSITYFNSQWYWLKEPSPIKCVHAKKQKKAESKQKDEGKNPPYYDMPHLVNQIRRPIEI